MPVVQDFTVLARRALVNSGKEVPQEMTPEQIRQAAFAEFKESDFMYLHQFRLNAEWHTSSNDQWLSVIEISGIGKISNNMGAMMACVSRGLLSREQILSA